MDSQLTGQDLVRPGRRVVKRYANRKLYDTEASRYVTLGQIAEMVRAGENVQVVDNTTQEDKTYGTLALILSEQLKHRADAIPVATLHALIRDPGSRASERPEPAESESSSPNPSAPAPALPGPAQGPKEAAVQESRDSALDSRDAMTECRPREGMTPSPPLYDHAVLRDLECKVAQLLLRVDYLERQVGQETKSRAE